MKKLILILLVISVLPSLKAQDLKYYLPDSISYNPAIPKPKDIIYHEVGEWHVTHDRLVNYMKALSGAAPDRVKMETMGFTYEGRPQVLLIITSARNHQNLEQIRQQHVQLSDPSKSSSLDIERMPIVVWVGHSIHGNESSGANASLLSAYYLAAGQGKQIEDLLDNVVILFDPSFNPDGLQRFSTWVNQHKSKNLVSDPNDREFSEVWPGGRFNHYWFDLNRDWLPAVHVESQNRLKWFHQWKPNILTDHHEQGSNATFFFQPGVPSRVNPLTPDKNQELTAKLGKYHAAFLDRIGSLYFTKENYDDFYYGKGSTYPDVNGAIGILFEQASSRGHLQQTSNGLLSFPFTIRNQFVTTLSTLEGARALRKEFLTFQRDFYKGSMTESSTAGVKGFVFGDENDPSRTRLFVEILKRHLIDVYPLNANLKSLTTDAGSMDFNKGSAFVVPSNQPQYKLIKAIFDKTLTYKDSLFYDITAWTMPLAFGLPYSELNSTQYNTNILGEKLSNVDQVKGGISGGRSEYAYLLDWKQFYAPAVLYDLRSKGIIAKVATNEFEMLLDGKNRKMDYGTILVPVKIQTVNSKELYDTLLSISNKYGINFTSLATGNVSSGSDLGSSKFQLVTTPSLALLVGTGVSATDAGEVWHLLDQRMNIPATHLDISVFNRVNLSKYTTIIMAAGTYPDLNKEKLKLWVQNGGTIIALEEAVTWLSQNGVTTNSFKKLKSAVDSSRRLDFVEREQIEGAQQMNGAIFVAEADLTNPLAYGYSQKTISFFKSNKVFLEKSNNPFAAPFYYKDKPLQSGWVSRENLEAVRNAPAVLVNSVGSGRVINIDNNPNFRAFWLGGTKLFMNAIFFGNLVR